MSQPVATSDFAVKGAVMTNETQWCFAWYASRPSAIGSDRAALQKKAKWSGRRPLITASFLDGDARVRELVKTHARGWVGPGLGNLQFDFRDTTETDIRISFAYAGSWSVIGNTCRQITDRGEPTMNFGWLTPASTDDDARRVVLHEFGHALGLIHEHQNPRHAIQWNRDAVIADLSGPPNKWSPEVIERNMFEPYSRGEVNSTQVDASSIMMYPVPSRWTTDGFSAGLNRDLSATDKAFIKNQYR